MAVCKRKHGSGTSWVVDFAYTDPVTGQSRRYRRVAKGARTRRAALAEERRVRDELTRPPRPEPRETPRVPFADFAAHWVDTRAVGWKPSYARSTNSILKHHLVPTLGHLDLRAIGPGEIEMYKASRLRDRGAGKFDRALHPKTVNNHLGVLSSLLEDAVRWNYAEVNPARTVRPCKTDPSEMLAWTQADARAFLDAIASGRPRWLPLYTTALHTGMRLGELAALRWSDIDLQARRIRVMRAMSEGTETRTKGGDIRYLPMSRTVLDVLEPLHPGADTGGRVFLCDQGRVLTTNRVKASMKYGIKASGVPRIRFHDLRHTFASILVTQDVSLYRVQKLLGHKHFKTTQRYAHLSPSAQEQAVAILDGVFGG